MKILAFFEQRNGEFKKNAFEVATLPAILLPNQAVQLWG